MVISTKSDYAFFDDYKFSLLYRQSTFSQRIVLNGKGWGGDKGVVPHFIPCNKNKREKVTHKKNGQPWLKWILPKMYAISLYLQDSKLKKKPNKMKQNNINNK